LVIARQFNTYGPRQSARAVIPTVIVQLLNGNKEIKLGSLYPTRDLNYVEDSCRGFLALAKCDDAVGRVVNIGSGEETSIKKVVDLIIGQINPDTKIVSENRRKRPEKSEVERLVCDNGLLKKLTGWAPEMSLNEGLSKTVEWFREEGKLCKYKSDIYNI
jgi:nucleoside-diphosphate-sugar epimerase